MHFKRIALNSVCAFGIAIAAFLVPLQSKASESESPVFILYEFEDPDLEIYTRSLVDILNILRFLERREQVRIYQGEQVDIIFVSIDDAIINGNISKEVLNLIGSKYSSPLSNIEVLSDRCSIHQIVFDEEETLVGIQNKSKHEFDIECVHLTLALFLGVEFEDFDEISEEEELQRLISAARR